MKLGLPQNVNYFARIVPLGKDEPAEHVVEGEELNGYLSARAERITTCGRLEVYENATGEAAYILRNEY